jgi:hypothetical protein
VSGDKVINIEPSENGKGDKKDVDHTVRSGAWSMLRSAACRVETDLPDLATIAQTAKVVDEALTLAVANMRLQGHSWSVIGRALGVTREAATMRFSKRMEVAQAEVERRQAQRARRAKA